MLRRSPKRSHVPSKCEAGSQKCCKDLANTKLDLRNAANSLQIEGKGAATWGPSTVPLPPGGVVGVWHCPPPPLWCGGGVVWYVGYVWCVWSVWYGMFGKYGMFGMYGRYGMYGMRGWYCMDGRYGM